MTNRSPTRVLKIHLKNFQSIEDIEIELGNFTVICGRSDIGKSAVLRALTAVVTNDLKAMFIRKGQTQCSIRIDTTLGSVTMVRDTKKGVSYIEEPLGQPAKTHTKTNNVCPEGILDILGFRAISLDKDLEIIPNITMQGVGEFPLDQPEAVVSKILGKISNLNTVFNALRLNEIDEKSANNDLSGVRSVIEARQQQVEELTAPVIKGQEMVSQGQILLDYIHKNKNKQADLSTLLGRLRTIAGDLSATEKDLALSREVVDHAKRLNVQLPTISKARVLIADIRKTSVQLDKYDATLNITGRLADLSRLANASSVGLSKGRFFTSGMTKALKEIDNSLAQSELAANLLKHKEEASKMCAKAATLRSFMLKLQDVRKDHNAVVAALRTSNTEVTSTEAELRASANSLEHCPLIKAPWAPGCQAIVGGAS